MKMRVFAGCDSLVLRLKNTDPRFLVDIQAINKKLNKLLTRMLHENAGFFG
jgi:hypothetical protein